MTSQTIPTRKCRGFRAGAKAVLLAAAMLCSQAASADPAIAGQILQLAKLDYQQFDMYYQQGKLYAQIGQVQNAQQYFLSARLQATMISMDLLNLRAENVDTLHEGQCNDCNKQEIAIQYNSVASLNATVLDTYMSMLVQSPTSQQLLVQAEMKRIELNMSMLQLEQAMLAAQ
ncbi:hypothetical protein [Luteimonas panaciterrae]|uniref:hypothetical protein n=1 Tax=Luteimonas panaciterrae TaxID=363885 RepID=UPI001CFA48D0|nr:hypothetical protein [Luteimonas panaciterrae]